MMQRSGQLSLVVAMDWGSKDVTPDQIVAVYEELTKPKSEQKDGLRLGSWMMLPISR